MFVAGTDTSAATLEWTMTELAEHPELMKQAREEVRAVGRPTGKVVDKTHLQHLHFIKAAIEEAMRLHPSIPGLNLDLKDQDFCFLPFGGGTCGSFGLASVEIALARLLFYFDWDLPHGFHIDDVNVDEIFSLATRKQPPLVLSQTVNGGLWGLLGQ
ncbi:hypothetical protein Gogos_018350 [Gossypium gossypioides]|uniref:Cytochrome P450 n=1 Tax=Gossypium gossypioides TaxID=34282 RepID=A0A7J9BDN4_GOSGO|nr:hypothetical protein [Gossypium gossypioides]